MKTQDDVLLEQAYIYTKIKHVLLQEGYSAEEINLLQQEGKIGDALKQVGRYAAPLVAAASMMGGTAKAQSPGDPAKDAQQAVTNVQNFVKHSKELRAIGEDADKLGSFLNKKLTPEQSKNLHFHLTSLKQKLLLTLGEDESNLDNVIQNLYKGDLKMYNWNALNF